ncbi:hypothetical protein [Treponema sp.]|uniref:hypothetical protein n=1 Tax=Treponema sp. TaxID=166 RepID=UPI003FA25EDB
MNCERVKNILLSIENTDLDFEMIFSGKESKKVNGLYKPETREIILHNKNFKTDNQLVYTAIHEYTHHLMNEIHLRENAGLKPPQYARSHTNAFWAKFHSLLEIAEKKGLYVIGLENSPELAELTENIRKNYLEKNGILMQEFGKLLARAHELCIEANIRYEDYIDRCLKLPRQAARSIVSVSASDINPAVGFENMKMLASVRAPEKRKEAQGLLEGGQSPDSVRARMKKKADDVDVKTRLEKEKARLEKTIGVLTSRLEMVEESLASL